MQELHLVNSLRCLIVAERRKFQANAHIKPRYGGLTVVDSIKWGTSFQNRRQYSSRPLDVEIARDVLGRLLPTGRADQFEFKLVDKLGDADHYRVTGVGGRIYVEGTSPAVALTGVHEYLKRENHVSITWNGDSLNRLPAVLPAPSEPICAQALVPHRYVGNETWTGYTDAYWDFDDWRHEIDVLAMNGINEVLVLVGQVSVYYETFKQFGYSDRELREWMPPPAHQPWFHLQSMHTIMPLPKSVMEQQEVLAREILIYMRSLGITPVFPGYFGMVPPKFAEKYDRACVIPQGNYGPYDRVDQLDPTGEHFPEVADKFYATQSRMFGNTTMYNINLVHEGGNPGSTPISLQAQAVESALRKHHPEATWTMLGWWHNPLRVVLDAIDTEKVLILDGMADITRVNPEREFNGAPYSFGSIWNYGGRTYLRARIPTWIEKFHSWREPRNSQLRGIAILPESNDTNPAACTFMAELAWDASLTDFDKWICKFSTYRYGGSDDHAIEAWQTIAKTAYSMEMPPPGPLPIENSDPFVAEPDVTSGAQIALNLLRYEDRFDSALEELLQVADDIRDTTAYRYDLLDVARQSLANHAYQLHAELCIAYAKREPCRLRELSEIWLRWMKLLDKLTATNKQTLLGRYLENAKRWGNSGGDKAITRYDAISLVTIWAPRKGLDDYAGRAWSGLTGGYYYDRWRLYLEEIQESLRDRRSPKSFDWHEWGVNWIEYERDFVSFPAGDVVFLADEIRREVRHLKDLLDG